MNALIWAVTIMAAAIVVKVSDNVLYLLLALLAGSVLTWLAVYELSPRADEAGDRTT